MLDSRPSDLELLPSGFAFAYVQSKPLFSFIHYKSVPCFQPHHFYVFIASFQRQMRFFLSCYVLASGGGSLLLKKKPTSWLAFFFIIIYFLLEWERGSFHTKTQLTIKKAINEAYHLEMFTSSMRVVFHTKDCPREIAHWFKELGVR